MCLNYMSVIVTILLHAVLLGLFPVKALAKLFLLIFGACNKPTFFLGHLWFSKKLQAVRMRGMRTISGLPALFCNVDLGYFDLYFCYFLLFKWGDT